MDSYRGSNPKDYTPSKEDKALMEKVYAMFELSKDSKQEMYKEWRESEALYQGHHWEGMKVPQFKNKMTIDLIGSAIDTMIPILNSRPPKLDVLAVGNDPLDYSLSETLQAVMDEFWQLRCMQNLVSELLQDYLVYGTGILKVHYNPYDDLPDCDIVDPYSFFINPSATKLENAEWVIYASPTPLYEIRKMFPEKGQYVMSDKELEQYRAQRQKQNNPMGYDSYVHIGDGASKGELYRSKSQSYRDKEESVLLIECYMRDNSKEYVSYVDGEEIDDKDKGRGIDGMRKVCMAGNVVLFDGRTKYPFFNKDNHISHPFPFVSVKNMGSAHEFWGRPEPRRLKHLNLALDRIASQVMDNVHLMANPMWVVDQTADVQDQINNKPGSVIRKRGAGQVSMQSPASMPSYVFNLYSILLDMFETVSGVNKSTQGKADTNVTSGIQASILQKASSSKIDYKARTIEMALAQLGNMWLTMFKNLGTKFINVPYQHSTGRMEYRQVIGLIFKDKETMVRVRVGSMLPENRQFNENKIMQLAQMGIIKDPMYIVQNLDMPQKEALISKMMEEAEALAEQQRAMAEEVQGSPPDLSRFGGSPEEIQRNLQSNPDLMRDASEIS